MIVVPQSRKDNFFLSKGSHLALPSCPAWSLDFSFCGLQFTLPQAPSPLPPQLSAMGLTLACGAQRTIKTISWVYPMPSSLLVNCALQCRSH